MDGDARSDDFEAKKEGWRWGYLPTTSEDGGGQKSGVKRCKGSK